MAEREQDDEKETRGGRSQKKGVSASGSESKKSGEILGAGQGGPSRSSKESSSDESVESSDFTKKSRGSSSSSERSLGEGGEREGLESKESESESESESSEKDIDVGMGRGQYGGQQHGQAPGAGA